MVGRGRRSSPGVLRLSDGIDLPRADRLKVAASRRDVILLHVKKPPRPDRRGGHSPGLSFPRGRLDRADGVSAQIRAMNRAPHPAPGLTKDQWPPRTLLLAHRAAAGAAQPATHIGRASARRARPRAPASFQFCEIAATRHAAASQGTARVHRQACQTGGRGERAPIPPSLLLRDVLRGYPRRGGDGGKESHVSFPLFRASRRAMVSAISGMSSGFLRNSLAPARFACASTSLAESMMIGVCCR